MKNYNKLVYQHFFNSQAVGEFSKEVPHISVQVGQGSDTDRLQLQLQFTTHHKIKAARFKAYGNPYTVAAASLLCELLPGLSLENAKLIRHTALQEPLEIPITRRHSALLAEQALQTALQIYERGLVCTN
jgi:nitrogen fixation NifU-like protein